MTEIQAIILQSVIDAGQNDIRKLTERQRQKFIDLAMMEPPLVDIDGDWIFATEDGRKALVANNSGEVKENVR